MFNFFVLLDEASAEEQNSFWNEIK